MSVKRVPWIVGTDAIAEMYGVTREGVARSITRGRDTYRLGYVGRVGQRHCWDMNIIVAELAERADSGVDTV